MKENLPDEMKQLAEIVLKLGWNFAIPEGGGPEDDGLLHGMIVGEQSYIDYILKHLD
jgi:hypothetical protein